MTMSMELTGKVAIVTGGGSGIGQAIATLFANEGASVVIGDLKPGQTREAIESNGGKCVFVQTDVRLAEDAKKLVDAAINEYGQLDIICNNAGVELIRELVNTNEDDWDRILNTNLKSVFLVSKSALPHMIARGKGAIVNIASQLGLVASEGWGAYCASKAGVIQLTKVLALENAKYNIRANCVCPGAIDTPMVEREVNLDPDPIRARQIMISKHPIQRLGRPDEIAQAALFLASDRSSFVTGTALVADGGFVLA